MKRLTINARTASGAVRIVRTECARRGMSITDVTATKRTTVSDLVVAAFDSSGHGTNSTFVVEFAVVAP